MFFYGPKQPGSEFKGDVWKMDANVHYMTHFNNRMFLLLLEKEGTFQEKAQIQIELPLCDRKMLFWERHPTFNKDFIKTEKEKVVKAWKGRV